MNIIDFIFSPMAQASSEHPLAKAIVEYARHFHFFEDSSGPTDAEQSTKDPKFYGWLLEASGFSALPGRGVQCFINGKKVLVSFLNKICVISANTTNDRYPYYSYINYLSVFILVKWLIISPASGPT